MAFTVPVRGLPMVLRFCPVNTSKSFPDGLDLQINHNRASVHNSVTNEFFDFSATYATWGLVSVGRKTMQSEKHLWQTIHQTHTYE